MSLCIRSIYCHFLSGAAETCREVGSQIFFGVVAAMDLLKLAVPSSIFARSLSLSLFLPFVCSRHVYPRIGSKARQIFEPSSATCGSKRYGLSTPYLRSAGPSPGRRDSQKYCFHTFLNQNFRKPAARWTGRGSTLLKYAVLKKIQVRLTEICLWPTPNSVLLRCHRFSAANGDFLTDRVFAAIE